MTPCWLSAGRGRCPDRAGTRGPAAIGPCAGLAATGILDSSGLDERRRHGRRDARRSTCAGGGRPAAGALRPGRHARARSGARADRADLLPARTRPRRSRRRRALRRPAPFRGLRRPERQLRLLRRAGRDRSGLPRPLLPVADPARRRGAGAERPPRDPGRSRPGDPAVAGLAHPHGVGGRLREAHRPGAAGAARGARRPGARPDPAPLRVRSGDRPAPPRARRSCPRPGCCCISPRAATGRAPGTARWSANSPPPS